MIKVAINGFGRIGRGFFRLAFNNPEIKICAINDLGDLENLAYLLDYDTVYGEYEEEVSTKDGQLIVDGKEIKFYQEIDPEKLPWGDLGIDVVIESTGVFKDKEGAGKHIKAGAKRVIISAPSKDAQTVLLGINEEKLKDNTITNNGSCTTNAVAPVMNILAEKLGVKKAILNTVHAYTATQSLVDSPSEKKDMRRGRAAAENIIPSTTGAAIAVTEVVTSLKNLFDGMALRIPAICGSIADVTFIASRKTTKEEVNKILEEASKEARWQNIMKLSKVPLVSSDIVGNKCPSIVDSEFTNVVDGDLVKILVWYDNEGGYSWTLMEHALRASKIN
jgi:glyceraldehyde 3-phosphate dehydrogenase